MIISPHNPKIILVRQLLSSRKERERTASFVVEGIRLAEEAVRYGWTPKMVLWSSQLPERGKILINQLEKNKIPIGIDEIPADLMAKISDTETPQGILMVLNSKGLLIPEKLDAVLILDGVRDPGNLGTILRTAAAFGTQAVLLLEGNADPFSPKVVRAGMGAQFHLPIQEINIDQLVRLCKSENKTPLNIFLADVKGGKPGWQVDLRKPAALIVGGEATGASHELIAIADEKIYIPMPGGSESLNAAVAASILLYEMMRQRQT